MDFNAEHKQHQKPHQLFSDTNTCLLAYWLAVKQVKGLRTKKLRQIIEYHPLKNLFLMSSNELLQLGFTADQAQNFIQTDWQKVNRLVDWQAQSADHHIIHWQDQRYPERLRQISAPPLLLFAIGNVELLSQIQIAIVGSRNATRYGSDNAFYFAKSLAESGVVVTSGLATGIDACAHKGALAGCDNSTIAVIGTGPDIIYPKRNAQLTQQIIEKGLVLSEFEPGTPARAQNFPRRNRIISGLSSGVLVVEAALQSGSLITAKYALEQNREVFAIPSSIHEVRSKGCHQLIKHGAKLVESTTDILEEIQLSENLPQMSLFLSDSAESEKNDKENFTNNGFLVNLDYEVTTIDELVERTQLPLDVVISELMDLELQGLIAATSGGYTRLKR